MSVPAEVVQVLGDSGHRGVQKVRCKIVEGNDKGKILVRDVMGPVREQDVLLLQETEMEG